MFTAKLTNKQELPNGNIEVTTEFTNGTKTITETVIPQDKAGYKYWVRSRIESMNTAEELLSEDNLNKEVDLTQPEPTPTPEEQALNDWRADFAKLESLTRLKTTIEAGGGTLKPAQATALSKLAQSVLDTFKADYVGKF